MNTEELASVLGYVDVYLLNKIEDIIDNEGIAKVLPVILTILNKMINCGVLKNEKEKLIVKNFICHLIQTY